MNETSAVLSAPPRRFGILRPWLFGIGGGILAAALIGNQIEYAHRRARLQAKAGSTGVLVRTETGQSGHTTIGIAEDNAPASALTFTTLGQWDFTASGGPPCPPVVQAHHGQERSLVGFMYPLSQGDHVRSFCLLRSTQTCCFGPRPQFNQYLLVETREAIPFERLRPVRVSGRFQVDPQPKQGYIYRFEDAEVTPVGHDDQPTDLAAYAREHALGVWDWTPLGILVGQEHPTIPAALSADDGKPMIISGHLLQADAGPPRQIAIGLHPLVGRPGGGVPTMFNAVTVEPAAAAALPEAWQDTIAWQGTLRVVTDSKQWDERGIIRLEQAVPCSNSGTGLVEDRGPILGNGVQAVLILVFLLLTVGFRPVKAAKGGLK